MKKRVLIIISVIAGVLVTGVLGYTVLLPRILLHAAAEKYMSVIKVQAVDYNGWQAGFGSVRTASVSGEKISLDIPAGYELKKFGESKETQVFAYDNGERIAAVIIMQPQEIAINLLDPAQYKDTPGMSKDASAEEVGKWFASLGHGLPDSGYNMMKLAAQLGPDDGSFWNIKKSMAFSIMGVMKEVIYAGKEKIYIYETGNVRGIISAERKDKYWQIQCEFFNSDDLNTTNTVLIRAKSPEDAYPIINSVKFS